MASPMRRIADAASSRAGAGCFPNGLTVVRLTGGCPPTTVRNTGSPAAIAARSSSVGCQQETQRSSYPNVMGLLVHDPAANNGESYDGKGIAIEPFASAWL